jgi:hypothetical protein
MPTPQKNFRLQQGTIDSIERVARETGAPEGDLADLCLRYALARMNPDSIRQWARTLPARTRRNGLSRDEQAVHERLIALTQPPVIWLSAAELASDSGLLLKNAFLALKGLQRRGLVAGLESDRLDRWNRPVESLWRKA